MLRVAISKKEFHNDGYALNGHKYNKIAKSLNKPFLGSRKSGG